MLTGLDVPFCHDIDLPNAYRTSTTPRHFLFPHSTEYSIPLNSLVSSHQNFLLRKTRKQLHKSRELPRPPRIVPTTLESGYSGANTVTRTINGTEQSRHFAGCPKAKILLAVGDFETCNLDGISRAEERPLDQSPGAVRTSSRRPARSI